MKRKKLILILSLSAVFLVALLLALLGKFVWGWFDGQEEEPYVPPTLEEEGEAYYYFGGSLVKDTVLMYPQIGRSDIATVRVHNTKGENYFFYHHISGASNYFMLGQSKTDEFGADDISLYFPSIIEEFGGSFDYTSLYDDATTLPVMLAAVGTVKIQERLRPENGEFSEEWLSRYGLAERDDPAYFEVVTYLRDENGNYIYVDADENPVGRDPDNGKYYYLIHDGAGTAYTRGEEFTGTVEELTPMADTDTVKRVYVGYSTVDDASYYLRLEGRNVVYTVAASSLTQVVERDIGYYVAPRLVTESESSYAYQLTPGLTVSHGHYTEDPLTVLDGSMSVGLRIHDLWTFRINSGENAKEEHKQDLYRQVNLALSDCDPAFLAALVGAHIGDTVDILLADKQLAEPDETRTYLISEINGVMVGTEYVTEAGYPVSDGDRLVLSYENADGLTLKGCLDLSDPTLPASVRTALVGQTVGTLSTPILLSVTYDDSVVNRSEMVTTVTSISAITDLGGNERSAVTYGSAVTFTYAVMRDGALVGNSDPVTLYIPAEADVGDDEAWLTLNRREDGDLLFPLFLMRSLGTALLGQTIVTYSTQNEATAPTVTVSFPLDYFSDFTLYDGAEIECANAYEEIITFGYTNQADVYFGSSRYVITGPGDRDLYGLDSMASLTALRIFQDLKGDETVALGIDDEVIRKYGLYAYRIYYELPFNCYAKTDESDRQQYYYKGKVGYELLISELQPDGSRYVASTQYDNVVLISDGSLFDFVEWSFENDWVQNNLLMVSYKDLRGMVFDLNFHESDGEEFQKIYAFDVAVDPNYKYTTKYYQNGEEVITYTESPRLYAALLDGGVHDGMKSYASLRSYFKYKNNGYFVDYAGVEEALQLKTGAGRLVYHISDTERYILELDPAASPYRDLDAVYDYAFDPSNPEYFDGSTNFQTLLQIINLTRYWGNAAEDDGLTEEEIAALLANDDACVMTIALTLASDENRRDGRGYTLRFYNYSTHSLVSITDESTGRETHHFYIQAREVAKIAEAVVALSRGEKINIDRY